MTRKILGSAALAALLTIIFSQPTTALAFSEVRASINESETGIPVGGSGFIMVRISIPEGSYIYGNPKGPGIGKATVISVSPESGLSFGTPRFLPPKKHTAPGENDYVWIYEKATSVLLPINASANTKQATRSLQIRIEALMCSEGSCMLQAAELVHTIRILPPGSTATGIPSDLLGRHTVQASETPAGPTIAETHSLPMDSRFSPRYVSSDSVSGIVQALILGIIAGFILNFMPCVLPVVSLKLMGFVQHAGRRRRTLVRHGLLFSLGILTSFALLASLASTLGYNWGELFQKKQFLIGMIAVIFAMGLSLLGVFTLGVPSFVSKASRDAGNPYMDSYLKGALATLLATPCSGPFLGGTLAFAFTQPPAVIFTIFMSIGLGMALPYLALSAAPGLIRFVPRPGGWTTAFEQLMGFLLLGTAVYLTGILSSEDVMPALWFLLILGIGLWQYGRYGNITRSLKSRIISASLLALFIVLGCFLAFSPNNERGKRAGIASQAAFDMDAIERKSAAGEISIVKFTADWCPNCVLVERTSLYTTKVISLINENSITLYTADITRENPEAQKLLQELGSRSIPFLAVFPPGEQFNEPICLRDIYSESDVLEVIRTAVSP